MSNSLQRRHVVGTLLTGGLGGLAGLLTARPAQSAKAQTSATDVFCSELKLLPVPSPEKPTTCRVEFVPTKLRSGHVFCTLTSQDDNNPAITSLFAKPIVCDGVAGAEITIHFLDVPRGEVVLSLLHIGTSA